jgi:hypothetical protein
MESNLWVLILGALLAISEVLGTFDFFKNSSVFSLVVSIIKKLFGK